MGSLIRKNVTFQKSWIIPTLAHLSETLKKKKKSAMNVKIFVNFFVRF